MSLRRFFVLNGWLMIVLGFAFWGYHYPLGVLFGIETSIDWSVTRPLTRALSFAGLFGGALMTYGFACLAMTRAADEAFLRTACPYLMLGHGFFGVITFIKQQEVWETSAGVLLTLAVVLPGAAYFYFVVTEKPARGSSTSRERRLREIAGQEERSRLAQDLHDSVKQQIYSVQTNLAAAQARWEADPGGARDAVDRARSTARDAMSEMVALLDRLRQDPVESIGLVEALRRQAEALGYQTGAVVITEFDGLPAPERLAPGAMTAIFRVAQEAMANISRHARPAHVSVTATSLDGRFVITIRDDGRGFPIVAPAAGMGLSNMRSRAAELGARLSIEAAEGAGCEVVLSVPLIDPVRVNRKQLERRLLAVTPPLAVLTLLAVLSPGFWMYTWPLLAGGVTFAAAQAWPLLRLR